MSEYAKAVGATDLRHLWLSKRIVFQKSECHRCVKPIRFKRIRVTDLCHIYLLKTCGLPKAYEGHRSVAPIRLKRARVTDLRHLYLLKTYYRSET